MANVLKNVENAVKNFGANDKTAQVNYPHHVYGYNYGYAYPQPQNQFVYPQQQNQFVYPQPQNQYAYAPQNAQIYPAFEQARFFNNRYDFGREYQAYNTGGYLGGIENDSYTAYHDYSLLNNGYDAHPRPRNRNRRQKIENNNDLNPLVHDQRGYQPGYYNGPTVYHGGVDGFQPPARYCRPRGF